ncbi:hypothetical protein GAYE_SCF27MG4682 [Galdieria yellowstonensis]|uniref:DNA recombination and repair protein Rad51-like C-terminal domain-containing protein n=1 Tax=Galdieria yellowstonensis TaxID=3028027 RepID=A0AAV9IH18_9RHOD|nr:hypothetical protein GAYE_SCF27MG4682 [Galdieria yellowstonensis]
MQLDSETGLDAFYRLKRKHFPQVAFHTSFFCPIGVLQVGDLVEISGPTKCGKSQFLYQCTANYVLNQLQSEYFRKELQLVWIDMDWNFDVSRLRVLLQSSDSAVTFSEEQVSRILEELQVCCPQDDWQLLLYLSDLQEQIQTSGKSYVLFMDGIGGWHHWNAFTSQVAVQQACFKKLSRLLTVFPVACLASVKLQVALPFRAKATSLDLERSLVVPEYLPQPWKHLVTQKLVIFQLQEDNDTDDGGSVFFVDHFIRSNQSEQNNPSKAWKLDRQWKMKVTERSVSWEICS